MAVMAFLHSTGELLGTIGDGQVFKAIDKIVGELFESVEAGTAKVRNRAHLNFYTLPSVAANAFSTRLLRNFQRSNREPLLDIQDTMSLPLNGVLMSSGSKAISPFREISQLR